MPPYLSKIISFVTVIVSTVTHSGNFEKHALPNLERKRYSTGAGWKS